jgi:hypothetical protein
MFCVWVCVCVSGSLYARVTALAKLPLTLKSWLSHCSLESNNRNNMDFQPKRMDFHLPFYNSGVYNMILVLLLTFKQHNSFMY